MANKTVVYPQNEDEWKTLRSRPYPEQHAATADALHDFLPRKTATLRLPIDPTMFTMGRIEWAKDYVVTAFTRAQVRTNMKQVLANIRLNGSAACKDLHKDVNMTDMLAMTNTVTKGKNEGAVRNLCMTGLAGHRRVMITLGKQGKIEAAITQNREFYAVDVLDKEGQPRIFASKSKAIRAYCQTKFGKDWHTEDKASRKAEAATQVYGRDEKVGKISEVKVNQFTLAVIDKLSAVKVISLAKKAGAPKKVTTGKGAGARSMDWFSSDIKHLAALNATL